MASLSHHPASILNLLLDVFRFFFFFHIFLIPQFFSLLCLLLFFFFLKLRWWKSKKFFHGFSILIYAWREMLGMNIGCRFRVLESQVSDKSISLFSFTRSLYQSRWLSVCYSFSLLAYLCLSYQSYIHTRGFSSAATNLVIYRRHVYNATPRGRYAIGIKCFHVNPTIDRENRPFTNVLSYQSLHIFYLIPSIK